MPCVWIGVRVPALRLALLRAHTLGGGRNGAYLRWRLRTHLPHAKHYCCVPPRSPFYMLLRHFHTHRYCCLPAPCRFHPLTPFPHFYTHTPQRAVRWLVLPVRSFALNGRFTEQEELRAQRRGAVQLRTVTLRMARPIPHLYCHHPHFTCHPFPSVCAAARTCSRSRQPFVNVDWLVYRKTFCCCMCRR